MTNNEMLKYSDNPKLLKKMLPKITMECDCINTGRSEDFPLLHDTWEIILSYKGEEIVFEFQNSNAELGNEPDLYSILVCVGCDGLYEAGTFESFCSECGYDTDSQNAFRTYEAVCEQQGKINKLFTREELEALPS